VLLAALARIASGETTAAATSPDGQVRIEVSLRNDGQAQGVPHYRLTYRDQEVVGHSRLGFDLHGGARLGGPCDIEVGESRTIREDYTQITGKRSAVTSRGSEVVVRLRELAAPQRSWELVLRACDDGAAFRYRIPQQAGWAALAIAQERTVFRLSARSRAYALPLNSFNTPYERRYAARSIGELPRDWLLGLPLLVQTPGGVWVAVTEADMNEFAGLYLAPEVGGWLGARLSPLPGEPGLAVRHALPHVSPWRVFLLGDQVGRLVESDMILNLSEPCAIRDTSWIRPGKTTFPWWNGFYEENLPFTPGLNTATAKYYIEFCAASGIPCHSLDGVNNIAWYGGTIVPYAGAEPTSGIDGLDLQEVLRYAQSKGVRIRLWMHWQAAERHMHKAFPLYRTWGIEGVMLDFMDRDDQEMNRFVRQAVKLAAENQLTVTLHGCPKPTGLERTYPNLLTHEAVMNLEFDKWDKAGITPDHELTVPFTRMLAGPLDFHQGSFRAVRQAAFEPRNEAPLVIGTPARTLAGYVVYQNHLSMVADYPSAYRGHAGLPILAAVPTTWDDTRVLDAQVGKLVVIARRTGRDWYVGAMTDGTERELAIPLHFLQDGHFEALVVTDDSAAKDGLSIRSQPVSATDSLRLKLPAAGGALLRIRER